jgi:hypothetical protein
VQPVLALPAERRINGILASVRKVYAAITAAPASSGGTLLQEQIELFMHTPAAAGITR